MVRDATSSNWGLLILENTMLKSERYTSKYLNQGKLDLFQDIDLNVKDLKNGMSSFCHEHIFELFNDKNFQVHYKSFKNDYKIILYLHHLVSIVCAFVNVC